MNAPYISFKNVNYSIEGRPILSSFDLSIARNEFVAITGENGSGKTTMTKLLLGILHANTGEVTIDCKDVSGYKLHEIGAKIGYVFQNPSYQIFAPTVFEELSFAMKYKGVDSVIIKEKVNQMIDRFSLNDARDVTTYNLSQGEKQRLAIACMVLNDPEFVVLDEPTCGLDMTRKIQLLEYLKEINCDGVGVLIISHDKDIVSQYAERVILLKDGKVYENK